MRGSESAVVKDSDGGCPPRLNRLIASLAVPAVVSNITVPLLGLSDTAISGHLGSTAYLGAMAVAAMMLNVVTWLCGFLRMGTTGLTAVAYGAGDTEAQWRTLVRSVTIALCIGIVSVCLQVPLVRLFMWWTGAAGEVGDYAALYFSIAVWGIPPALATMAMSGWFIGMQNTVWPMAVAIVTNLLNIGLSLLLAVLLDYGFEGVAWGTACANWLGALIIAGAVMWRMRGVKRPKWSRLLGRGGWSRYFTVNINLFLRSACVMAVSVSMTSVGSRLGEEILAANALMMQFFIFFSFVMDGLAFAGEALTGRYAGAGKRESLLAAVRRLLLWSAVMAVVFSVIYTLWAPDIMALITDLPGVVATASGYKIWLSLLPLLTVCAFIFDGFYIGMLHTRQMLYATLAGMSVFMLLTFVHIDAGRLIFGLPGNAMLWSAFLAWLAVRGGVLGLLLPRLLSEQTVTWLAHLHDNNTKTP
ncbi:MAG: MATE family efflux transporter [Muribaculaceae bacterium]|nr:MATE family efflux transporter [Muribaculaceae bacterium]